VVCSLSFYSFSHPSTLISRFPTIIKSTMERVNQVVEGVEKVALGEGSEKPTEGASQALKHSKADKKSKKAAVSTVTGPLEVQKCSLFIGLFF